MDIPFIEYISPLLSFGNIFGLIFFTTTRKTSKLTSFIFILPVLFSFGCLLYLMYGIMKTTQTNYLLSTLAAIGTTILRAPNYYYYKDQLKSLIVFINDMNSKLKIGRYKRKHMILNIGYLMLFSICFGIFDCVLLLTDKTDESILLYYVYSISIYINFLETFFMYVLLKQMGNQFAYINSELGKTIDFINLDLKIQPVQTTTMLKNNSKHFNDIKLKAREKYFKNTYQLSDYHFVIINQCKIANGIFALPSLYILGTEFTIMVGTIQVLAIAVHTFASGTAAYASVHSIAISVYWSIIIMMHFYYYVDVYRFVAKESSKTSTHIHHIWNTLATNDELDEQCNHLQLIAMQMLNNKIAFTAQGLFPLDRTLLQRIINATAVYVVILVQFYLSDQKKKEKRLEATPVSS